jgi:hypothetical protein
MKSKLLAQLFLGALVSLSSANVFSEPTSPPLSINYIRPYSAGNTVYIGANIAPGAFCASTVFSIDLSSNTGKAMYAAALTALTAGKLVRLELLTCAATSNDVSSLQSIYILN